MTNNDGIVNYNQQQEKECCNSSLQMWTKVQNLHGTECMLP